MAVKQCRHGLFAYNLNDAFIGRSLDEYGEWSEEELNIILQVLKPGDIALDIGANIGTHTVPQAKKVGKTGAVIAFEPQRVTFQNLCANVALNALTNVRCINAGVGDAHGKLTIPFLDPEAHNNFGGLNIEGHAQGESIDIVKVDDYTLPRCNLIKIDVEGMEAKVLAGASKTIAAHRPVLFVENNNEERSAAILKRLDALGYAAWWHIAGEFNPKNFFGRSESALGGGYLEANVLCFPREAKVNLSGLWPVEGPDDSRVKAIRRHGLGI